MMCVVGLGGHVAGAADRHAERVMIVELEVAASPVGIMISLPLCSAPFRYQTGFRSNTHRSGAGNPAPLSSWLHLPLLTKFGARLP